MLFGKRLTGQPHMCGKDMNNVSDIFENGLDRDTYRALKKMNREEMETFLKNYRKDALKEIKDNYFQLERNRQPHPAPPKNEMSRGTTSAQVLQCNVNCMQLYVTV